MNTPISAERKLLEQAACVIKAFKTNEEMRSIDDIDFIYESDDIFKDIVTHLNSVSPPVEQAPAITWEEAKQQVLNKYGYKDRASMCIDHGSNGYIQVLEEAAELCFKREG